MSGNYCPHCMKPATGPRCPNCGGDVNWRGQKGIDLPVGTVLTGGNGLRTYQIGAARGKGGFGITYVALETNSGRRMAVKEYFPTRCAFRGGNEVDVMTMSGQEEVFQSGMNSFLDEGKMLLSQDDLSCVVHVIDYFRANGTAYLVMEYLDGVALHAQMTRMGGRIPVSELMPRLAPLMRDIGQLHRRGVIHRDISPDNIMWMPDGTLKLLDFGSARSMENGKSMTVLMKHGFSPIEQYRSKGQGPYTDVYALAATIYYCVTGTIPPAAVERLDEDSLQSPAALGAALTVDQETALLWALSLQPNARPQSMEEFAARLYKDAPAPQPPIQTGGNAYVAAGMPQAEQPPQVRPVTGQNTAYQYSYNGQTSGQYGGQTPGQYGSQTSGQYGSQTSGQYGGQTPGQYGGQTPGQYGGQTPGQYGGQTPGQNGGQPGGGGGKKNTPIIIGGAVAAALVILVAAVIIAINGGSSADTPRHTTSPSSAPTPTLSVPTPAPTPITGVTSDGFRYEIIARNHIGLTSYNTVAAPGGSEAPGYSSDYIAVLTGYEGTDGLYFLPDDVEGVPVTQIAERAFAGVDTNDHIWLPEYLEVIGNNAFQGCSDLRYVGAFSKVTTSVSSFSGCDSLWFVYSYEADVSGWNLPGGVHLYYSGMETGVGRLRDFDIGGDLLAGQTEYGEYVLLDVYPGTSYVDDIDECVWICPWALDNLASGSTINLGDETLFSYETFLDVYYRYCIWSAPDGELSDMWLLSCKTAQEINDARPAGATQAAPDIDLIYAAIARAKELASTQDYNYRPDGSSWSTILNEQGINFSYSSWAAGYNYSDYQDLWDEAADYTTETFASAIAQGDYAGQYYSRVGVAAVRQSDGKYAWWGFVMIP